MSDPNITKLSTLNAKNFGFILDTIDPVTLISSNNLQSIKINSLYITNTNICTFAGVVRCYVTDGVDNWHIAKDIVVPYGTTIVLIDKEGLVYMEPNQQLKIECDVLDTIEGVISYDIMSE